MKMEAPRLENWLRKRSYWNLLILEGYSERNFVIECITGTDRDISRCAKIWAEGVRRAKEIALRQNSMQPGIEWFLEINFPTPLRSDILAEEVKRKRVLRHIGDLEQSHKKGNRTVSFWRDYFITKYNIDFNSVSRQAAQILSETFSLSFAYPTLRSFVYLMSNPNLSAQSNQFEVDIWIRQLCSALNSTLLGEAKVDFSELPWLKPLTLSMERGIRINRDDNPRDSSRWILNSAARRTVRRILDLITVATEYLTEDGIRVISFDYDRYVWYNHIADDNPEVVGEPDFAILRDYISRDLRSLARISADKI